jgi:hypothetical protein
MPIRRKAPPPPHPLLHAEPVEADHREPESSPSGEVRPPPPRDSSGWQVRKAATPGTPRQNRREKKPTGVGISRIERLVGEAPPLAAPEMVQSVRPTEADEQVRGRGPSRRHPPPHSAPHQRWCKVGPRGKAAEQVGVRGPSRRHPPPPSPGYEGAQLIRFIFALRCPPRSLPGSDNQPDTHGR